MHRDESVGANLDIAVAVHDGIGPEENVVGALDPATVSVEDDALAKLAVVAENDGTALESGPPTPKNDSVACPAARTDFDAVGS